jgi:uncharacterized integral membrane protein
VPPQGRHRHIHRRWRQAQSKFKTTFFKRIFIHTRAVKKALNILTKIINYMEVSFARILITSLFLTFIISNIYSQERNLFPRISAVEINLGILEYQLKGYLFKTSPFLESSQGGISTEVLLSYKLRNNLDFQIGVNYSYQSFKNSFSFVTQFNIPEGLDIITNQYDLILNNSLVNSNISYYLMLDRSGCFFQDERINDGDNVDMRFLSLSKIETIGIPIKIEKTFGKKATQLYLNFSLVTSKIISKKVTSNQNHFLNGIYVTDNKRHCYSESYYNHLNQLELTQVNVNSSNWNINNFRLDFITEFGIIHSTKSNSFKIGFFYGESVSSYSNINNTNYKSQTAGIKVGIRKKVF